MRPKRRKAQRLFAAALLLAGVEARGAVLESATNGPGGTPDPIPFATPGVVVRGTVAPGDVDFFSLTAQEGDLVTASLLEDGQGDFADPVLAIFVGASSVPLATDDDDGQGFLPSLRLIVPAGGESLRIAVSGFGDSNWSGEHQETFAYQLVVAKPPRGASESDEAGNDTTPEPLGTGAFDALAPGGAATLAGTLLAAVPGGATGDVDLYSLPVEPGRLLSVSLFDAGEGDYWDPVLRVLPPSDPGLQDDDDGPGLLAAILEWLGVAVPSAQEWTLEVTHFRDEPGNDLDTPYTLVASLAGRLCDADGDREVDQSDIESILAARGTAVGPSDARDLDQDLLLTVLDSRACVAHCDRARCARGCGLLGIEALLPLFAWGVLSGRRRRGDMRRHS